MVEQTQTRVMRVPDGKIVDFIDESLRNDTPEEYVRQTVEMTCPPKTGPVIMLVLGRRKGGKMAKRRHTPEQVINKLREAEVAIAEGSTVAEAAAG